MRTWQATALSDLLDAQPGFACGEDPADGVFQFRMNNITSEGRLDFSKKRRVPKRTRNLDHFLLRPGDVLFNATNSPELVGKSGFFPGYDEPAVFSNHFLRLRPQAEMLDGRFLARWLVLQFQRGIFQGMCRQWVNQAAVNRDSLMRLRIPVPPLPEQRRIAEVLDRAEALRATRRAALAQLDALTQSIFIDMFGDPATNPKAWPLKRLGDCCTGVIDCPHSTPVYSTGRTPYPCVRSSDIQKGTLDFADAKYVDRSEYDKRIARGKPTRGDVIYCREGARFGNAARVIDDTLLCLGQRMMLFRPNPTVAVSEYIWAFISSPAGYRQAARSVDGSAAPHVNIREIVAFRIPAPPPALQRDFAGRVAAVEKLKATHRASLAEFDALFASLQHRAFMSEV